MTYDSPFFSVSFGNRYQQVEPQKCKSLTTTSLFNEQPFSLLKKRMGLSALIFLNQVHKAHGETVFKIKDIQDSILFGKDGDYLITNQPTLGLGIVTADCLPIVYFDKINKVVGIAHAGWKGSVAGIANKVVLDLQEKFMSQKKDIKIFFGPSAKHCCYEVDSLFLERVGSNVHTSRALFKKNNKYFFDLGLYNASELLSAGFSSQQIIFNYNRCTICQKSFCSYRRQKGTNMRQVTVVSLK
ncbi:MAG: YfiH family protein [Alteromonas naphthalenivorans]|jgi:YfiH family protein